MATGPPPFRPSDDSFGPTSFAESSTRSGSSFLSTRAQTTARTQTKTESSNPTSTFISASAPLTYTVIVTQINTVSLFLDSGANAKSAASTSSGSPPTSSSSSSIPSTSSAVATKTSIVSQLFSPGNRLFFVGIVIIGLGVLVVTLLGVLIACYRTRRKRTNDQAVQDYAIEPKSSPKRGRAGRPGQDPSDFWSADVSNPEAAMSIITQDPPSSPNENAELLGRTQPEANRNAAASSYTALPAEQQRPRLAEPLSVVLEEQEGVDVSDLVQRHISEPLREGARSLVSPFSDSHADPSAQSHRTEYSRQPSDSSQPSEPSQAPPRRPSSAYTSSSNPFAYDEVVLSPVEYARPDSRTSKRSSVESRLSMQVSSVLEPQPTLQTDLYQAIAHLRRPSSYVSVSGSSYSSRGPRLDVAVHEHGSGDSRTGYFMYGSPESEVGGGELRVPNSNSESPSIRSIYSNANGISPSLAVSANVSGENEGMDGIQYPRGDRREETGSPALPDSVRTSVLSYFEKV